MKVKQLKRKMAALLAVAMVMTGQPSGVLAGGMPGDSGEASAEVTETVSTDSDATQNTKPDGSEIPPATNSTADSGTAGGNGGTGTDIPKDEQETFEVTYQVEPEEGAKVTGDRKVKTGETLEFTVRVNEGYELDSVSVSGDVLEPTEEEDNKYSYEAANIMQAPTVEVNLVEAPMLMALMELDDATPSTADDTWYVSEGGDDTDGNGSEAKPYASLAKAMEKVVPDATIELLSDIELNALLLVNGKSFTIDGGGHKVTRADNFTKTNDQGRGGYNPAMIEVANGATLTLQNITLDDNFLYEGENFNLASGTSGNEKNVQDGIIASYGDGKATIVLGEGTTLKNFGGLSAVYITGESGAGATLIMKSGSKICDDEIGKREGGYAAIFNHGGTVQAEEGSSIESIDGRAIYADNSGITTFSGTIKDITSNEVMKKAVNVGSMGTAFGGMAYYGSGNTEFTLGEGGSISDIKTHDDKHGDVALHLIGGTFNTEIGSAIHDIDVVGIADMNGATVNIAGGVYDCDSRNILFRMRGSASTFTLQESGYIKNCTTEDEGIIYLNQGRPTIEIAGIIDTINKPALYISNNGSQKDGKITLTETGVIKNVIDYDTWGSIRSVYGMRLEDPSKVIIAGTIANCSGYAIQYYPKANQSLLTIKDTATIENNNGGKAQVRAQNTLPATDAQEHIVVASEALKGNTTIDLNAFDVTLDDNVDIKLGNASSAAAKAIKDSVLEQHQEWTIVGSSAAWIQPSGSKIHFTVPKTSSMKNTALFAALLPLNEDGTPKADGKLILPEFNNTDPVDVTFEGLTADQSYAMMFVNNNEYTLAPDDITIYTGGGQGDETYDNGGFPKISLLNSIDLSFVKNPETNKYGYDLERLEIAEEPYSATAEASLVDQLTANLEATYKKDGQIVTDDEEPGEYTVKLSWKNGLTDEDVRVNGNNVQLGSGTLIVRYIDNIPGAQDGTTTHPLVATEEEIQIATHSQAVAPTGSKFYTNDDEDREVDAAGIQLLDDTLLIDEGDNRQELMENKAAEYLGNLEDGNVYRYDFRYLDLVDAYNGNAWVSASKGTTVYIPYPEGVTEQNADSLGVKVLHYKDLHREYGISGQEAVEEAIKKCELETMAAEFTPAGIKIEVEREGFSPFAVVWKDQAKTYTITINYLDKDNNVLEQPYKQTFIETDDYNVTAEATKQISGYHIVETKIEPEGAKLQDTRITSDITITVIYEKDSEEPQPEPETFTITATAGEHGSISPSGTVEVKEGEDLTFTITPDAGYKIAEIKVDGIVVETVNSYTFENVTGPHTIEVSFSRKSTGGSPSGSGSSGGSGAAYTVGLNGNWVHMDPNDINTPISQMVPDGATPVSNPEWHQWKFILTDGSALTNRWAFIRNPYAVEGQPSEGWFSFDEKGIMNYGWYLDQSTGKWYFLHRQSDGMLGTMIEGWHHDEQDGRWYYLQPGSGEMLLGWQEIGGRWYYFNPNAPQVTWNYNEATGGWTYNGSQSRPYGSMYQNEVTPDGYQVDGSGAWVQ